MPSVTLTDFEIVGSAPFGSCGNAGTFRAVCRRRNQPALLHRFRPADLLPGLLLDHELIPDFARPFATRITAAVRGPGSIYLVEPIPLLAVELESAWRDLIIRSPADSFNFVVRLIRQMLPVLASSWIEEGSHGAVSAEHIVVADGMTFGLLTAHVRSRKGRLWLRTSSRESEDDLVDLAQVLRTLLDIEASMSRSRGKRIVADRCHDAILQLAICLEGSGPLAISTEGPGFHKAPGNAF